MDFRVTVTHERTCTRVALQGQCGLGRLLSLLKVLEFDSANWPSDALLLDLRRARMQLDEDEQYLLAGEASGVLPRMRKVALLTQHVRLREASDVHAFSEEGQALRWLATR